MELGKSKEDLNEGLLAKWMEISEKFNQEKEILKRKKNLM